MSNTREDFQIPVWADKEFFRKVLQWKYQTTDEQVTGLRIDVGTNKGDGFVSEMFRLVVDSARGSIPLLLKKPHESPEKFAIADNYDFFTRENKFYLELMAPMRDILESVGEFEEYAPEVFFVDPAADVVVLRDLKPNGFTTGDRVNRLPRKVLEVLLRKLAKFHAASMVLNKTLDGDLEKLNCKLFDGTFNVAILDHIQDLANEMQSWGANYEALIPKMRNLAPRYLDLARNSCRSRSGLNALIHADPWYNNVLLREGSDDREPDVILIDYQTISWCSIGMDLVYLSITSFNESEFEDRDRLIRLYHSHLERVLRKLNWERVPTADEVIAEYRDAFWYAVYSSSIKTLTSADPADQNLEDFVAGGVAKLKT